MNQTLVFPVRWDVLPQMIVFGRFGWKASPSKVSDQLSSIVRSLPLGLVAGLAQDRVRDGKWRGHAQGAIFEAEADGRAHDFFERSAPFVVQYKFAQFVFFATPPRRSSPEFQICFCDLENAVPA